IVPPAQPDSHAFGGGYLVLYQGIVMDGNRIGQVFIQEDMGELYNRLRSYGGIIASILLMSSLVAFLLSSRLQRLISEPILHLAQIAHIVSGQKDYSIRAVKEHQDEVGE